MYTHIHKQNIAKMGNNASTIGNLGLSAEIIHGFLFPPLGLLEVGLVIKTAINDALTLIKDVCIIDTGTVQMLNDRQISVCSLYMNLFG